MTTCNPVKNVVAFHDISSFGRVSLTEIIPIMSTMGFKVCPVPTALLSNQVEYPEFSFLDLTDEMRRIIDAWDKYDVCLEALYSGFLGSTVQVDVVKDFINRYSGQGMLKVVDPVMADDGQIYDCFDDEMVCAMRDMAGLADVVTPNLTEAFLLLNRPYSKFNSLSQVKELLRGLTDMGPAVAVITSVPFEDMPDRIATMAFDRESGKFWRVMCPFVPTHYPGTGDAFASVLTGSLLQGDSLPIALERAARFVYDAIRTSFGYETDHREGVLLERMLPRLNEPFVADVYELV